MRRALLAGFAFGVALAAGGCTAAWSQVSLPGNGVSIGGVSGSVNTAALGRSLNGWQISLGVLPGSNPTPAGGGTGYVVGDALTLNDGCSTHAVVAVNSVSSGAVTQYVITNPGACILAPNNPVAVLSHTGVGSGATFTLAWGPQPAQLMGGGLALGNRGNLFLTVESPAPGLASSENTFGGDRAGAAFTGAVSSFNTAFGHDACGLGSGLGAATGQTNTCIGVDAGRNLKGVINGMALGGANAAYSLAPSVAAQADTAWGQSALYNLTDAPDQTGFNSGFGSKSCYGAAGATFLRGTCLGSNTGGALTSAQKFLIAGYAVGNVTFASGTGVILIGSGAQTVDTPLANTSNYINVENILTVTGTNTPSTSISTIAGIFNAVGVYQANGTAGVTCAGTPTASFASTNGIVTHC